MTAPDHSSPVNSGVTVEGQRRLLTKKGGWLKRPVKRWCAIEQDDLVYYNSKDSSHPRGRIPLRECAVGDTGIAVPHINQPQACLRLLRVGKRPCEIQMESADEFAEVAAYVQTRPLRSASSSTSTPMSIAPDAFTPASSSSSSLPTGIPSQQGGQLKISDEREAALDPSLIALYSNSPVRSGEYPDERWPANRWAEEDVAEEQNSPRNLDLIFVDPGRGTARDGSPEGHLSQAALHQEWVVPSIATESPMPRRPEEESALAPQAAASTLAPHASVGTVTPGGLGLTSPVGIFEASSLGKRRENKVSAVDVYREAMSLMWDYKLDQAQRILEPYRTTIVWHACAYAECACMRVVLTGRRSDAVATLELVRHAEHLKEVRCGSKGSSPALDVCAAELLLMRCGLQVITGCRLTLFLSLRRCWYAYRRLETILTENSGQGVRSAVGSCSVYGCDPSNAPHVDDADAIIDTLSLDDIWGRVCFGLGLFYLVTSLLPVGLCPLVRLAGFLIDRDQGKAYLARCVDGCLGPRATLATIVLSMYHLDLDPDMERAGDLLIQGLTSKPNNVLLHWAASLMAWRNADIESAVVEIGSALYSCGDGLRDNAIYLRYELGMFHFMAMYWPMAYEHLRYVHDAVESDKIFFPYRTLVSAQLAAVCFSMGRDAEGEALCRASVSVGQEWSGGALRLEGDFAKVMQLFLKRRVVTRRLLAFEVMYLLRQLPRVPAAMLQSLQDEIRKEAQPYEAQFVEKIAQKNSAGGQDSGFLVPQIAANSPEMAILVEHVSAQVMQCIILFYLGDLEQAMTFVPQLSWLCTVLPPWCVYLQVHGLYWCGRVYALSNDNVEAARCLRLAKVQKKYPFNISTKVSKVLDTLPPQ